MQYFLCLFWIFLLYLILQPGCQLKILLVHLQSSALSSKVSHISSLIKLMLLFLQTSEFLKRD